MPNYTTSLWSEAVPPTTYPPLSANLTVDVAVVGAGITGVTAARLLQSAGRKVAILEARRVGKGETGKTTAHLTEALDTRYHLLISRFGVDGARMAAEGQRLAIDQIASTRATCRSRATSGASPDSFTPTIGRSCPTSKKRRARSRSWGWRRR